MAAPFIQHIQQAFRAFIEQLKPEQPVVVLCHNDADGLSAGAILARTLQRLDHRVVIETTGKGENGWSASVRTRLAEHQPQALLVTDLGSRGDALLDVPTLLIDHHRPAGVPPNAELVTGYGQAPTPTSGLLAYWCGQGVAAVDDLMWIAAISLISDLGDSAPFALLAEAKLRYKATPLREAATMLNAPRRSATGDARPALALLLQAHAPRDIVRDTGPAAAAVRDAKAEVSRALAEAKKAAPTFSGNVALLRSHSPCQVHPLIAQSWRQRLPGYIVMAANTGYLPDRVNFSVRAGPDINVLDFLREHAPADAGEWYGNGHDQASGGALSYPAWNEFVLGLGFGPTFQVTPTASERQPNHHHD